MTPVRRRRGRDTETVRLVSLLRRYSRRAPSARRFVSSGREGAQLAERELFGDLTEAEQVLLRGLLDRVVVNAAEHDCDAGQEESAEGPRDR
ncbi:hypothetical protein DEJ43_17525 [Streptomyces venezuelae ATCC 10712]|nr:hypothetical protein DEJ43_17525 [Streptomyces venezuelae ATCC 10712]